MQFIYILIKDLLNCVFYIPPNATCSSATDDHLLLLLDRLFGLDLEVADDGAILGLYLSLGLNEVISNLRAILLATQALKVEAAHLGLFPPSGVQESLMLQAALALWLDDRLLRDAGVWDSGVSHNLGEVLSVPLTIGAAIPFAMA